MESNQLTQEMVDIFQSLPSLVQKFIRLLHAERERAIPGVGYHHKNMCPVALAFAVCATSGWDSLSEVDKEILTKRGFNQDIYETGLDWYDRPGVVGRLFLELSRGLGKKEELLRQFLNVEKLPEESSALA